MFGGLGFPDFLFCGWCDIVFWFAGLMRWIGLVAWFGFVGGLSCVPFRVVILISVLNFVLGWLGSGCLWGGDSDPSGCVVGLLLDFCGLVNCLVVSGFGLYDMRFGVLFV